MDAFSWWDRNGKLVWHQDDVRVYNVDHHDYLMVDQTIYASTTELGWYVRNVAPYAKGKCLEIGLGLGVASKTILNCPDVRHLLTIESNENVIMAFGLPLAKHHILHANVYEWVDKLKEFKPSYDFIFVDHYTMGDEEIYPELQELKEKLLPLLNKEGNMVFWIDENAPDEDQEIVKDLWVLKK